MIFSIKSDSQEKFFTREHINTILRSALWITLFNTMLAAFLVFVMRVKAPFMTVWVFSMIIGFCINVIIDIAKKLIWGERKPNRTSYLILCIVAAPLGYYIGLSIGTYLYGFDMPRILDLAHTSNRGIIVLSAVASLIGGLFFMNQAHIAELQAAQEKEKARSAAIERQAMQAQLQLLQAQIEPHMLFNTLANLQGLIAIDPARAQHMLEQLIHYLRASLNSARTEVTTLKHEFELMRAYLELLAIRMGKRLQYRCELAPELERQNIAPMLIQPLIENAIKHGLEPKMEGGRVDVTAAITDQVLHIVIADTGLGIDTQTDMDKQQPTPTHTRVGNANIRERLFALYGDQAALNLTANHPCGTIAHLQIPLSVIAPALQENTNATTPSQG